MEVNLIATIPVGPNEIAPACKLLAAYGETARAEPGNLRFELYRDCEGASLVVIERYGSEQAFQAHLDSPENTAFNTTLGTLLGGGGSSLTMLQPAGTAA